MEVEIPWGELLDDLFGSILNELDSPQVAWVRSVCSSWKIKAQKLLHCIQYNLSDAFSFGDLVEQFPALKDAKVVFRGQHPELTQLHQLGALQQLQTLELCNSRGVLEFPFMDLSVLATCHKLAHLTMDGCHFQTRTGVQHLQNLESLVLVRCAVDIREPSLAHLLQGMTKLRTLRIEHVTGGSSLNLRGISTLQQLEHLTFRVRSATHPDLASEFGRMNRLKTLDVNMILCPSLTTFDDLSLAALAELTALEELNLGGHSRLTDNGIEQLSKLTGLTSLDISIPTQLHFLFNQNPNGITDRGLCHLLNLGKLQSLSLSFSKVSNRLLCQIVQRLSLLRHLGISNCSHVNDTALFNLDRCPHLTSLDISYCRQVSDLGLFGISKVARQLSVLNISGSHRLISDLGLRQLVHLKMLSWLNLGYCEQITRYGIEGLVSGTPYLKTLCMRGCYNITNEALESVSSKLPHIQDLDLGHCYQLTDEAVPNLLSMRCLRRIALNNTNISENRCHSLREKGITVHKESRWWMK